MKIYLEKTINFKTLERVNYFTKNFKISTVQAKIAFEKHFS